MSCLREALLRSRVVGEVQQAATATQTGLCLVAKSHVRVEAGTNDWPQNTSVLCWHCSHPFAGPPIPKPVGYDERLDRYKVQGCYCSWSCALADCRGVQQSGFLTRLHRAVCRGSQRQVVAAPPKYLLEAFGGSMSLDDFRGCEEEYKVVPARLVKVEGVSVQACSTVKTATNTRVDFSKAQSTNEVLKLKRDKPLPAGRGLLSVKAKMVRPQEHQ